MNESYITVSKRWNKPKINITIDKTQGGGLSLSMDIEDFKTAVKKEIGSIAMVFKASTFSDKFDIAVENVIMGIKEESIKVV